MAHDGMHHAPVVLEAPPNFPVEWTGPHDTHIPWEQEAVHFPEPVTPMDYDLTVSKITEGFNKGTAFYRLPMQQMLRYLNTYAYIANAPAPSPEGPDEEKLKRMIGHLGEQWNDVWLVAVKEQIDTLDAFDQKGADLPALRAHLDVMEGCIRELWSVHFQLAFPMLMAVSFFEEMHHDLFSEGAQLDVYALLNEVDNKMVQSARALWQLSRSALADDTVRQVIENSETDQVLATLSTTAAGQAFLAKFNDFLNEYGQRIDKLYVSFPSWHEAPASVIRTLKGYMAQTDRDLDAELDAIAARQESAIADARSRLAGYPQPVVGEFEFLLGAAQKARFLKEEHTAWLDFPATYYARQVVIELGRRLQAAGVIDSANDVFYLYMEELRATLDTSPMPDRRALVAGRRANEAHFGAITPPPRLGILPPGPPPDNPVIRAVMKVFGAPPPVSDNPSVLLGLGGSAGVVRGRARVLRSLAEADKLGAGDILVTATTTPPWTPLFANIAGVVTDAGGILSHPAVVAREYGIPAVVGTGRATSAIADGQTIEVNGDTGSVRIIE